jgi:hypothetical protein
MNSLNTRPRWWQLYLTFPLLIALFFLDHQLNISTRGHQAIQIGAVLVVYGLIHLWLKANARALSGRDQRQYYGTFKVIQIPPDRISSTDNDRRPILQLPDSEIKGMLSDTFDMNTIDATLLPIDDVSEEVNKD